MLLVLARERRSHAIYLAPEISSCESGVLSTTMRYWEVLRGVSFAASIIFANS
jgi:hypothetical protein